MSSCAGQQGFSDCFEQWNDMVPLVAGGVWIVWE